MRAGGGGGRVALRGAILTNLRADHVQVARAKGLSEIGVLVRHCLRNSAGPTLAMTGLMTGVVFAGVAVVEKVFAWPGIGFYITQSIPRSDFPPSPAPRSCSERPTSS